MTADGKYRLLTVVMDILRRPHSGESSLRIAELNLVRDSLTQLKENERYDSAQVKNFVRDFTDRL